MARIYTAKPARGAHEGRFRGLSERAERAARSALHFALPYSADKPITRDGVTLVIASRRLVAGGLLLEVVLDAFDSFGFPLPFSVKCNRTFGFVNPPYKVHDGTWRQEAEAGRVVDVMNMKEDVEEAFQQMLFEAVLTHARSQGWAG